MAMYQLLSKPYYNCTNVTEIIHMMETIQGDAEQQEQLMKALQTACLSSTPADSEMELWNEFPRQMETIRVLRLYVPPLLLFFGTFGNFFSFIILAKLMFKTSTYSYLAVLAIMDLLVLYVGLLRMWIEDFSVDIQTSSSWMCKLVNFLGYVCSDISVWLIVAVTAERFIAVRIPLRAPRMCNVRRARKIIIAIVLVICAINAHILWTVDLHPTLVHNGTTISTCEARQQYRFLVSEVWPWVDAFMYSFIPLVFITILNVLIVKKVMEAKKIRTALQLSQLKSRRDSAVLLTQVRREQESSKKMTFMLLAVSFTFLLTTLPMNIFAIVSALFGPDKNTSSDEYKEKYVNFYLGRTVVELLMYVNHSINFFLYCATGRKFRQHFHMMVCMCCQGKIVEFFRLSQHTALISTSSYRLKRMNSQSFARRTSLAKGDKGYVALRGKHVKI